MIHLCQFVFITLYTCCMFISSLEGKDVKLKLDSPQIIVMTPNATMSLYINDIPDSATYLLLQAHTQYLNVTLSETQTPVYGSSVVGHNVGLVAVLEDSTTDKRWFISHGERNVKVSVLVHLKSYGSDDPIPGGCNLVFPLENDPNTLFSYSDYITQVTYQWSNVGYERSPFLGPPNCENKYKQDRLTYNVYVNYLPQGDYSEKTYFKSLQQMLTVDRVNNYGKYLTVQKNTVTAKSRFSVTSRIGQGLILVVVVTDEDSDEYSAIYVPRATYNCDMTDATRNCSIIYDIIGKVLTVVALGFGLFLTLFGHRFFKIELAMFGLTSFTLVSLIVFVRLTEWRIGVTLGASVGVGVIGGLLCVLMWRYAEIPALSVILPSLLGGYLFASVLFSTPFGNIYLWNSPLNYGLAFTFATILFPAILLAFTRTLNILACTFVGSYLTLLLPDYYLYGSMIYLLLSSVRKATSDSYLRAVGATPFAKSDIALSIVWGVLFIGATIFQLVRAPKNPPFPLRRRRTQQRESHLACHIPITQPIVDERSPLLPSTAIYTATPVYSNMPTAPPPPNRYIID